MEIATSTAGTLEPEPPPLALALAIVAEAQLRGPRAVDLAERAKFQSAQAREEATGRRNYTRSRSRQSETKNNALSNKKW